MKFLFINSLAVVLSLVFTISHAHHGSSGQFDTNTEMQVSGIVTDIRFVNPHSYVYFDVTNEDGSVDPWRCELRAGSLLKRNGWTTDMFATGTKIQIKGSPARREPFGCLTLSITFDSGRVVSRYDTLTDDSNTEIEVAPELSDGTPNFNGNWVAERRERGAGAGAMGPPPSGGSAMGGPGGPPTYALTEAGKAASAGFVREDNPRFHCEATNIILDWWFDQHVNKIEQTDEMIVITYGFMDIVRTIHLNMDTHPEDIAPSRAGHSIGSWDGDTLVVDTVGFEPGYLDATRLGVKHSNAMHVVERISLSEDGKTLNNAYTVEDQLYLAEPFEGSRAVVRTNAAYDAYECEDLTEEVVEGF